MTAASDAPAARYRRDIDGLRAVAVLAVVAFHFAPDLAPGGFIGVDVFFVISGYLITGIIATEAMEGRFSLARFYMRRARRILPALLFLLLAVLAAGILLFPPTRLMDLAESAVATLGFYANFHFNNHLGYFDAPASSRPLLHTWSLAVEEQFYLLWPFVVLGLARMRRRSAAAAAILVALGLILAEIMVFADRDAAFFLAPARLWELALGGWLFLARPWFERRSDAFGRIGAALGVVSIAASIALLEASSRFPGLAAAPACFGAALAIGCAGRPGCWTTRALSAGPMVWIGLISYSLYLWHWPVLVFYDAVALEPRGPLITLALFLAAVAAARLSYLAVERPFRRGWPEASPARVLAASGAAILGAAALWGGAYLSGGLPFRAPEAAAMEAQLKAARYGCGGAKERTEGCPFGRPAADGAADILLFGDSHAQKLTTYLDAVATARGLSGRIVAMGGCAPLIGAEIGPARRGEACKKAHAAILSALRRNREASFIVLVGRWSRYSEMVAWDDPTGRTPSWVVYQGRAPRSAEERRLAFAAGLERTVERLLQESSATIVLAQQAPPHRRSPTECVAMAYVIGRDPERCAEKASIAFDRLRFVREEIDALAAKYPRVVALDLAAPFCDDKVCRAMIDGRMLYRDDDHLSNDGARWLFERGVGAEIFGGAPLRKNAFR